VTIKRARGLRRLRTLLAAPVILECIAGAQAAGFRITHYSIQNTHVHLLVEAEDNEGYSRAMRGFVGALARGLNRVWERRGCVFPERFHDRALRSVRAVRNAIKYVLNNYLKHGGEVGYSRGGRRMPDPYSSGRYFDGWHGFVAEEAPGSVVVKGCWKSSVGWKRHYPLISLGAAPGCT